MKKLSLILAGGVIALMPLAMGGTVSAAGTCQVGFTGPDSKNICTSTKKYTCEIDNNNKIEIKNDNNQVVASGDAKVIDNTGGGDATTGLVTNSNDTTFNATVTNNDTCVVVATVPATITPPAKTPVPAPGKGAAAVLPNTSGDAMMAYIFGLVGLLGVGAIATRVAVIAYGHMKS